MIQTRIEYLRGKVEDSQTINHHGKTLDVEGGKVVNISEVGGGQADEITPVVPFDRSVLGLLYLDNQVMVLVVKLQTQDPIKIL